MKREYTVGQAVVYVDPTGARRHALVKCWWVQWPTDTATKYPGRPSHADVPDEVVEYHRGLVRGEPGCNLVFVSADEARNDVAGRQTEIATSVVHKGQQVAHGNYWCWPEE